MHSEPLSTLKSKTYNRQLFPPGKIYVAGGFSGLECLSSSEQYDPVTDQWTMIEAMNFRRSGVTVVSFQNTFFAIGGFNGVHRLDQGKFEASMLEVLPIQLFFSRYSSAKWHLRVEIKGTTLPVQFFIIINILHRNTKSLERCLVFCPQLTAFYLSLLNG